MPTDSVSHPNGPTSHHHRDFRPLPLCSNAHVQTFLGYWLTGKPLTYPAQLHFVRLPDDDQLAVHDSVPSAWKAGDPMALLVHGLNGCHASPHVQRLAQLLLGHGIRVARLDLRGCAAGLAVARRPYHGGSSGDVRAVLAEMHRWAPASPLYLTGFSLGGNIVLKLAGEAARERVPQLAGVAAVGPPIDLAASADLLGQPCNRIYERFFLRSLLADARHWQRLHPGVLPAAFPRRMSVRLFDDLFTAPLHGFADSSDYYDRCSSWRLIPHSRVPSLLLTARDDPFIAVAPFESLPRTPGVEVHIAQHGGHLGFLGPDGAGGIRWAERRVAEWIVGLQAARVNCGNVERQAS